jgi:hypothetical protein
MANCLHKSLSSVAGEELHHGASGQLDDEYSPSKSLSPVAGVQLLYAAGVQLDGELSLQELVSWPPDASG